MHAHIIRQTECNTQSSLQTEHTFVCHRTSRQRLDLWVLRLFGPTGPHKVSDSTFWETIFHLYSGKWKRWSKGAGLRPPFVANRGPNICKSNADNILNARISSTQQLSPISSIGRGHGATEKIHIQNSRSGETYMSVSLLTLNLRRRSAWPPFCNFKYATVCT